MSRCGGAPDMCRKMTRLALASKCGFRGVIGSAAVLAQLSWASRLASASPPRPTEPAWRKCRRVRWAALWKERESRIESPFGQGFIQVEEHVAHDGPGCQFDDIHFVGRRAQRFRGQRGRLGRSLGKLSMG